MEFSKANQLGNSCPNLPGYRSNTQNGGGQKKHGFTITHGVMLDTMEKPGKPKRTLGQGFSNSSIYNASLSMASLPSSPIPSALKNVNQVLSFECYFKEAVNESTHKGENYRVRKCKLYYYLEDNTAQVVESKQENSGVPQGNLVKRQRIPAAGGQTVQVDDLVIGEAVSIYSRVFFLCGCNGSTANWFLQKRGIKVQQIGYPPDPFDESRKEFMLRETGADFNVSRNARKGPMKKHMEATLGNTVNNNGRAGFMEYGSQVLRFDTAWDDTTQMYGDVQKYVIHYFLSNNEVEVLEVASPNSGRDNFPKLLKRALLPKVWGTADANGRPDEMEEVENYHWRDFQIGNTINVYSRKLRLVDADDSTRRFFESQGQPLGFAEIAPKKESKKEPEVSQYNGWGSEADSMASCKSLLPKPPKTQFDLAGPKLSKQILRFQAKFGTPKVVEDNERLFVVSFFVENNSISIQEPPQRNTGIIGGKFLERQAFKNPETGRPFEAADLFVGGSIKCNGTVFKITDVDEATLKYMEHRPIEFTMSDVHRVMNELRERIQDENKHTTEMFRRHDTDHSGHISIEEFKTMMADFYPDMVEAEIITLMRHFDKDGSGLIDHDEFVKAVEGGSYGHELEDARKYSDPWIEFGDDSALAYTQKAEKAAEVEKTILESDNLIMQFTQQLLSKGHLSTHLLKIAGHGGQQGHISKKRFIHGISMARGYQDAETDGIYFPVEQARQIAHVMYYHVKDMAPDGSPTMSFDEISNKISHFNVVAGGIGNL